MNKFARILLAACLVVSLMACRSEERKAERVAYLYSKAMANYRIDDAEPYVTEETLPTLDFLRRLVKEVPSEYIERDTPATIEITQVSLTSDTTAWAHYHKTTPNKDFRDSIPMVRREGKWRIHIPMNQRR